MQKILVTGANGQLGSEFRHLSSLDNKYQWIFTDREKLDLTDLDNLTYEISQIKPDLLINCAAYTAVDKAESEIELADVVNHQAVAIMADWTYTNDCKFIHVSTDYVYDGTSNVALIEDAPTGPINIYGKTKLAGDNACLKHNPLSIVIRTSWVYSSFGTNFVKTMLRLLKEKDTLNVVDDQIGSPTYAADLAQAIFAITNHSNWQPGVYNYSNLGEISWYKFALAIQEISGIDCKVSRISSSQFLTAAKRPGYSLLDKSKIINTYGLMIPDFESSLRRCMGLMN